MKYFKISLIFFILTINFSCDTIDNLFNSDDELVGGGSIIGQWSDSRAVISLSLTTNSNQVANNFLNSTGEIIVSGDYNTKLSLMVVMQGEDIGDEALIVANINGFVGGADTSYMLLLDLTAGSGSMTVSSNDETEFSEEMTNAINFTYDGITLNIINSTVENSDNYTSANLNGMISLEQVPIPANSSTAISSDIANLYDFGSSTVIFNEDSSFSTIEEIGTGANTGTWTFLGDTLQLTISQEVVDPNSGEISLEDTTLSYIYFNSGNEFNIAESFDLCEGLIGDEQQDQADCDEILSNIEEFFKLDNESLEKAELNYQLFFEKIPTNETTKLSKISRNQWKYSIPQEIKQYFITRWGK